MKYKVIKSFAGIEIGEEIPVPNDKVEYMLEKEYIEPIKDKSDPKVKSRKKKVIEPEKNK